ncbi:MAG: hypothetical protein RL516_1262 [Bacteroidota bacterium]|jgi:hypothetical protein
MKIKSLFLLFLIANYSIAQPQLKKVLFVGNSYTAVNDLPALLSSVAQSAGDSVIYESNCIGGYTLQLHSTNATTLQKIAQGDFDFVVLQEQSQLPSFPTSQVQSSVYPYAKTLDSLINLANSCTETVFYMTWGRKNGDASNCPNWPPVCTYTGMDSLLRLRYEDMASTNNAVVSPVGAVWRYIRNNHPSIELYSADESHPSIAGSYAAACTFYSILFRKDPTAITFASTLDSISASTIRNVAKLVAYDSLSFWNVGDYDVDVNFSYSYFSSTGIIFMNQTQNCDSILWDFGDGQQSNAGTPIHIYQQGGTYTVTLVGYRCNETDTFILQVPTIQSGLNENEKNEIHIANISKSGIITLEGNLQDVRRVEILNQEGKLIYTSNNISNTIPLISNNSGMYLLNIHYENFIRPTKFVFSK